MAKKTHKAILQDPNYAKELAKYDNPVPSRDFILQVIRKQNSPMSKEEIFKTLAIVNEEQQEAMRRRLRAMPYRKNSIYSKAW